MRLSISAAGVAVGLFFAAALVTVFTICALTGGAGAEAAAGFGGPLLRDVMSICPGAGMSAAGAAIGAGWLFAYGFFAAAAVAFLYNLVSRGAGRKKSFSKKGSHRLFLNV